MSKSKCITKLKRQKVYSICSKRILSQVSHLGKEHDHMLQTILSHTTSLQESVLRRERDSKVQRIKTPPGPNASLTPLGAAWQPADESHCDEGAKVEDCHAWSSHLSLGLLRLHMGYLKYQGSYRLPGSQPRQTSDSPNVIDNAQVEFAILSIPCLSSIILHVTTSVQIDRSLSRFNVNLSFRMESFNQNPNLKKLIEDANVEELQVLFDAGAARPTDYLPSGATLVDVSISEYQLLPKLLILTSSTHFSIDLVTTIYKLPNSC